MEAVEKADARHYSVVQERKEAEPPITNFVVIHEPRSDSRYTTAEFVKPRHRGRVLQETVVPHAYYQGVRLKPDGAI